MEYDTRAIRKLLSNAFNDDELIIFCFDYFPEVSQRLSPVMGLFIKIQILLDYCKRYGQFEKLLQLMKQENPHQYERHKPYERGETTTTQLTLHLNGELSDLTAVQQGALTASFQSLLASILDLCVDEIEVLNLRPGSIILEIRMPQEAAQKLNTMLRQDASWLTRLGIMEVKEVRPASSKTDDIGGDFIPETNAPAPLDDETAEQLREQLRDVLHYLSDQERGIIEMRFGLTDGKEHPAEEVATHFQITRQRVRQIEAKAFRLLRHPSLQQRLQDEQDSTHLEE